MTSLARYLSLTCLTATLAWSSAAGAADPEAALEAERLFEQGQELFDAGKFDEACDKLQQSLEIDWAIGTLLNVARCHAAQGKTASAWRGYVRGAQAARKAGQIERAEGAEDIARKLALKLSHLTVHASDAPRGVIVTVDDAILERDALGRAHPIDPGPHAVRAQAPGHRPWATTVEVRPDRDDVKVNIPRLESLDSPAPAPEAETGDAGSDTSRAGASDGPSTLTIAGAAVGGAGVVVLVIGGVLGGLTLAATKNAEDDPALCPAKVCTPTGREKIDAAETQGIAATALMALGGGMLAAGGVMVGLGVSGSEADDQPVAWIPIATPHHAGMLLGGRF